MIPWIKLSQVWMLTHLLHRRFCTSLQTITTAAWLSSSQDIGMRSGPSCGTWNTSRDSSLSSPGPKNLILCLCSFDSSQVLLFYFSPFFILLIRDRFCSSSSIQTIVSNLTPLGRNHPIASQRLEAYLGHKHPWQKAAKKMKTHPKVMGTNSSFLTSSPTTSSWSRGWLIFIK